MPHRLSKWSFPASLVPPWCPAGCPISPFLPPWCLPGACQAVQMVLSCRRPAGVCPLASGLSKFQWRPACFVPNPGVGPTAGFSYHKTAFKWPLGAPVAQNCLSKASRSTDPSSTESVGLALADYWNHLVLPRQITGVIQSPSWRRRAESFSKGSRSRDSSSQARPLWLGHPGSKPDFGRSPDFV